MYTGKGFLAIGAHVVVSRAGKSFHAGRFGVLMDSEPEGWP